MEADLILATIYAAKENQIPDEIEYPTHLNSRDLMIGHLYIYLHGLVMKAFTIVGLRKIMVFVFILNKFFFIGVFFAGKFGFRRNLLS